MIVLDCSCVKIPDLRESLKGRFDNHHALIVGQPLTRLGQTDAALANLDVAIADAMTQLLKTLLDPEAPPAA